MMQPLCHIFYFTMGCVQWSCTSFDTNIAWISYYKTTKVYISLTSATCGRIGMQSNKHSLSWDACNVAGKHKPIFLIISKIVNPSFVLSTKVQRQIQSSCEYQEVPNRQKSFFNVGPPKESIFLTTILQSSLHTLLTREPPIVFELLWKSFWRRAGYEPTEVESCNLWSKHLPPSHHGWIFLWITFETKVFKKPAVPNHCERIFWGF